MPAEPSIFKTPELERQFMQTYEAVLGLWEVAHAALDIPTSFGLTHINTTGARDGPAMVLLPGFGANSTMWFPNIATLSTAFRCYAVDTNGQPGRSLPDQKLTASNNADWLDELMDGLGLRKACFVGVSLGGWLALNLAICKPARVEKAVLLDPAASFEKMSGTFLRHSFLPFMVHPTRARLVKYFLWMTRGYQVNQDWSELMLRGILNTRPQSPIRAKPFSDAQLRSVRVPVLALIAERSLIYNPQRACERARRLIPGVTAEIVQGASHALNAEKAGLVNERIVEFCKEKHATVTLEVTVT